MNKKILFLWLFLATSTQNRPSDDNFIIYEINNNYPSRNYKLCTEEHFFEALRLLLIHKNDGYISYDSDGIQISVWEKYYNLPTTINPIYSMKLKKITQDQTLTESINENRSISKLNNKKIDDVLKACDMTEIIDKVKGMLLQEQFGVIQVQNSTITTVV